MEFDAKTYNETNKLQLRDGKEMIDRIRDNNNNKKLEIVLDIGCGSGNLTILLADELNAEQIYGIDIDKHMIEFAKQNYLNEKIVYFIQDLSADWDQLVPELRSLEGKVDLIFVNYVIHFIQKKVNFAQNICRLLSKSGIIYIKNILFPDPFTHLEQWKRMFGHVLKVFIRIPTIEKQNNSWINVFKSVGLDIIENKISDKTIDYEKKIFEKHVVPIAASLYSRYVPLINAKMIRLLASITRTKSSRKARKYIDESTGHKMIEIDYKVSDMVLKKDINK